MSEAATRRAPNPPLRPLAIAATLAGACGGGSAAVAPLPPLPDRATRATLAGPLCDGETCRCHDEERDAGEADAGRKRFEIKLGPADHELWATIDGMVVYKSRETATACFYVDLAAGTHAVALRGAGEPSVGFEASISERGGVEGRSWWYDTFDFSCGAPGTCDRAALDEIMAGIRGKKGKLDPCGSTKVKDASWHTGRLPDHGRPTDLEVGLKLQVYEFVPENPPGSEACGATKG